MTNEYDYSIPGPIIKTSRAFLQQEELGRQMFKGNQNWNRVSMRMSKHNVQQGHEGNG